MSPEKAIPCELLSGQFEEKLRDEEATLHRLEEDGHSDSLTMAREFGKRIVPERIPR